uniref:Reverse transcriptase domain-containing protein n=1 Tax=Tanacetum cinerariifolium TaxID=118510 RepID=A0A6L2K211_TANCI|nr:hypothetical protein [Tanacetum cinerariifolium]
MSSPNHPTSDIEDAFSSNFPDYIPASSDYVPASLGKTYSSDMCGYCKNHKKRAKNRAKTDTRTERRRRNKRRVPNIVEPELRTIIEVAPMADNLTIEELLQAPTEGYGEAIVILEINADHFEIKTNLIQLEMLRACPHHGFMELTQIDTFYNGLNYNDHDSLNAAVGGNILSKTTREALSIVENKSKVHYSRNKPNVSRMNTTSRENTSKTDDRIDKLADQISTLVDIFSKKVVTPATAKAVKESCVTCGGTHAYYNCPNTDSSQSSVCAATGTYNQVAPQNRASNYMAPPSFAPVQNNSQNSFSKQEENLRKSLNDDMRSILAKKNLSMNPEQHQASPGRSPNEAVMVCRVFRGLMIG